MNEIGHQLRSNHPLSFFHTTVTTKVMVVLLMVATIRVLLNCRYVAGHYPSPHGGYPHRQQVTTYQVVTNLHQDPGCYLPPHSYLPVGYHGLSAPNIQVMTMLLEFGGMKKKHEDFDKFRRYVLKPCS
ncbi:hypothetical protein R6Q59_012215 [Mikania micrantha]